ncbi:hypothetical protein COB57_01115 [Candidatus Peregrinibacteria bacterium]|nr:MAG: hypothetical protein COB57_01115 [Candidatus Peregrinibacteria bacterium]
MNNSNNLTKRPERSLEDFTLEMNKEFETTELEALSPELLAIFHIFVKEYDSEEEFLAACEVFISLLQDKNLIERCQNFMDKAGGRLVDILGVGFGYLTVMVLFLLSSGLPIFLLLSCFFPLTDPGVTGLLVGLSIASAFHVFATKTSYDIRHELLRELQVCDDSQQRITVLKDLSDDGNYKFLKKEIKDNQGSINQIIDIRKAKSDAKNNMITLNDGASEALSEIKDNKESIGSVFNKMKERLEILLEDFITIKNVEAAYVEKLNESFELKHRRIAYDLEDMLENGDDKYVKILNDSGSPDSVIDIKSKLEVGLLQEKESPSQKLITNDGK